MAISFVTCREFATIAIIGSTTPGQLEGNFDCIDCVMDEEVLGDIQAVQRGLPDSAT